MGVLRVLQIGRAGVRGRSFAVLAILLGCGALLGQTPAELRAMLDKNQAFGLRDTVERSQVPEFYRGAVEESENRLKPAKRDLERAIAADPHGKEAFEAHEMLSNAYLRNGQFRESLARAEAAHAIKPDSADLNNWLPLARTLAESHDMEVVERHSSRFEMRRDSDGSRGLPVTIDGKEVTYGFDTGAALSVMGISDARLLGLAVTHVAATNLSEASGKPIAGFDIAVAEDLVIAGLHLRRVPFFVLQDTGEPWVNVPVGKRGLIGLPVLLAMQTVRWEPAGWFAFGKKAQTKKPGERNLLFHGATVILRLHVKDKPLIFSLDTGAIDTDLNEGFANALPEIVETGQKETRAITGLGGSVQYDSVLLGPVTFNLGGLEVTLKAPHVFPKHSLGSFDGNLGHDILDQAKAITLDFKTMSMELE